MWHGNVLNHVCLFVCLVWALTSEFVDLQISFWYAGTSTKHLGQVQLLRSRSYECNHIYILVGDLPSSERQSCGLL